MRELYIAYYRANRIQYHKTHRTADAIHYKNPCIGYVVEGSAEYIYEGKKYALEKGDLVYIPKNSKCISIWQGSPDIVFYSINFEYLHHDEADSYAFQVIRGLGEAHFCQMVQHFDNHYLKSLGSFYMLLDELIPMLTKIQCNAKSAIFDAVKYLDEHYTAKVSMAQLAAMCNLSLSGFYARFKQEMGCTPVEYKNNLLIQKAANLLLHHGFTVEETARELGFSTTAYFRKLFKKLTGKLPKELKH